MTNFCKTALQILFLMLRKFVYTITLHYIHARKEVDRGSQRGGREVKKRSIEVEKRSTEVERVRGTPFERVGERVRE